MRAATLWFDFVDPVSYLLDLEVRAVGASVEHLGLEVIPPPRPLTSPDDPVWTRRWAIARPIAEAAGVALAPPRLVPWTRKAHELHLHAREAGGADQADAVRVAIYEAFFAHGQDIGRIDKLIDIAAACGLDPAGARTVLGVDRHEPAVQAHRRAAATAGIEDVPSLTVEGRVLRGFHNRTDLLTLLR